MAEGETVIVYALIDPRDDRVRYIGKSHRTPRRRLRRHLAPCYLGGQSHKERWIRSLLRAGLEPRIEVLETCCSSSELSAAERAHIARFLATGADLTNATPGGDGGGGPHTPESREKIRLALKGKPKSEQHRRRARLACLGRKATESTRAKLREVHSRPRKPLTAQHRLALSRAKGGHPFVDQYGNVYDTQKGAARCLGLNVAHVNAVLHGRRPHTQGFRFHFISEEDLRVREYPKESPCEP